MFTNRFFRSKKLIIIVQVFVYLHTTSRFFFVNCGWIFCVIQRMLHNEPKLLIKRSCCDELKLKVDAKNNLTFDKIFLLQIITKQLNRKVYLRMKFANRNYLLNKLK